MDDKESGWSFGNRAFCDWLHRQQAPLGPREVPRALLVQIELDPERRWGEGNRVPPVALIDPARGIYADTARPPLWARCVRWLTRGRRREGRG